MPLQHLEHHQRDDALVARRQLPQLDAAVGDRDRRHVGRALGGEIIERVQAAERVELGDDVLGHLAGVEPLAPLAGDDPERLGQRRKAHDLARARHRARLEEMRLGARRGGRCGPRAGPVGGHARRHRRSPARPARWPAPAGARAACVPWSASSRVQPSTAPGTVTACTLVGSMRSSPDLASQAAVGARRRAAGGVERDRPVEPRLGDQREAVAADAGHVRLDHGQHRGGGDGGIDRVAPGLQHLDGRQARRGMRRGAHRPAPVDERAPGEVEVAHGSLRCR